jgi:predicted GNAT family acetyltransferase
VSEVVDNRARHRFELEADGAVAFASYEREDGIITFTHTIVPPELQGRGIGSILVKGALAIVCAEGLKVVPECAFVRTYIEKHPEEQDLLA